jgi:hypothetical protein
MTQVIFKINIPKIKKNPKPFIKKSKKKIQNYIIPIIPIIPTNHPIYTFIHPTKTAGTSTENFFKEHYSSYITGNGHITKCTNDNNPIIIVRDVYSRFLSIYYYWKNGAIDTQFKRNETFTKQYNNVTIKQFIKLLQNKEYTSLFRGFTWASHFLPISHWIDNTQYKNIIIIRYEKNLNDKIQTLLNILKIPNKGIPLPLVNITNRDSKEELDEQDKEFVKTYFKDDVELIKTIKTSPHFFKLVI